LNTLTPFERTHSCTLSIQKHVWSSYIIV